MEQLVGNFIYPGTLSQYAMDTIVDNYQLSFAKEIPIPSKVSNAVFAAHQRRKGILDEDFLKIFSLLHVGKLTELHLMRCSIVEKNVRYISTLLTESIRELSLYVERLPKNFLHHLNKNAENLEVFNISGRLFQSLFNPCFECKNGYKAHKAWSWILKAPKLKFFCVKWNRYEHQGLSEAYYDPEFLPKLVTYFKKLEHLEIGGYPFLRVMTLDNTEFFEIIQCNITSLIFNDVLLEDSNFQAIESLKNLEYLDISSDRQYDEPGKKLESLIFTLEKLKSLDISGTNLDEPDVNSPMEIYGLRSRKNNPLEFLGLYHTRKEMCRYLNIPANKISGHSNLEQLTNAARIYSGGMKIAGRWLDDFSNLDIGPENIVPALQILLEYMAQLLDFGFEGEFIAAMSAFLNSLTESNLNFAIRWELPKTFLNICTRSDCPHVAAKDFMWWTLQHLPKSSRELNYFMEPFINIIFMHLKDTPPSYDLALHFSRISDEHQKRFFVDQNGMLDLIESSRRAKTGTYQMEQFWETVKNLISGNLEITGIFLKNGVSLFLDLLPSMLECTWDNAVTAAAKVFVQIIIQFKDLSVSFFASDQFLDSLIEAFTKDRGSLSCSVNLPHFYLGFMLAQFLTMENFLEDFGRRNYNKVVEAFRVVFANQRKVSENHRILKCKMLGIGGDLIDPIIDLMRRIDIPESKSLAIWGFFHIIKNCYLQKMRFPPPLRPFHVLQDIEVRKRCDHIRDYIRQNREVLKLSLDDFVAKYGAKYHNITDLAEIPCRDPLICGD